MLVTRILLELDAQLERLQTARDTIASLIAPAPAKRRRASARRSAPTAPVAQIVEEAEDALAEATVAAAAEETLPLMAAVLDPAPAKRRGRPKGSGNRRAAEPRARAPKPAEPTALARVVATGPVFVSAAELERRRAQALVMAAPRPEDVTVSEGTLDALIREVAERRTATAA